MHDQIKQQPNSYLLLLRARPLLEEGRDEQALAELEAMQADDEKQRRERDYFLGWCYILAQRWDDAMGVLSPLAPCEEQQDNQVEALDRERYARSLLRLAYAAINLNHFADAERHLRMCLKLLRHKQLQRPEIQLPRIQALYSLGVSYAMRGLYAAALQHYEEALAELYVAEDNFSRAREYCAMALQLSSQSRNNSLRGCAYLTAGKVALAEAGHTEGERGQELLEEARGQFETAHTDFSSTEAYDEVTATLTLWAQTCEGLGRSRESLTLWRTVYQTQAKSRIVSYETKKNCNYSGRVNSGRTE